MNKNRYVKTGLFVLVFIFALTACMVSVLASHREISVHSVTGSEVISGVPVFYSEERININTATKDQLLELPGIGDTLAERIIEYRTEFGSFYDVGELREIKGIGDKLLREILPYICV